MMKLELHTTLTLTHREPERVVCSLMTFVPLALRWTRALDMMTRHKCTRCGRGQRHEAHSKGHPPSSGTHSLTCGCLVGENHQPTASDSKPM